MPVFRYFVVVGLVLLIALLVIDYSVPRPLQAEILPASSLLNWRKAEAGKRSSSYRAVAVVFSNTPTMPLTDERAQYERQLMFQDQAPTFLQARAELVRKPPRAPVMAMEQLPRRKPTRKVASLQIRNPPASTRLDRDPLPIIFGE